MFKQFNYFKPASVAEAVELSGKLAGNCAFMAGGTDVLVKLRSRSVTFDNIISLKEITDLSYIRLEEEELLVGAMTTLRELESSSIIKERFTVLHDAVKQIGSVQVRNVGTLGGNICSSLPSADSAAPLLALEARVRITGPEGDREVALKDFFTGPGKNVLKPAEIVKEITIPVPPRSAAAAYIKLGRRKAMEIPLLGAAVYLDLEAEDICKEARIALTTMAPTPIRVPRAEAVLVGGKVDKNSLRIAGEQANLDACPRSSRRCSEEYRRKVLPVLVRRAGTIALKRSKEAAQWR
ncbi:MAG TPA: xanthine dehydrogenase family protein subunit M [Firmicutes bacterium]|nr:xanthine dehydrogenase family protein subunit M [Bacillota bacterium]